MTCPSVWTTCTTIFKSSANWFTATLGPEVFLEIFLRERASKPTSLADNECEAARRERVFFFLSPRRFGISETRSSSPPIDTVICSFPGIASTTTNFHFVNGLVRYVPIFIIDTKVQHLWIGSPAIFAGLRQRYIKQSHIICESVRYQFSSYIRRWIGSPPIFTTSELRVDSAICWLKICRKGALGSFSHGSHAVTEMTVRDNES